MSSQVGALFRRVVIVALTWDVAVRWSKSATAAPPRRRPINLTAARSCLVHGTSIAVLSNNTSYRIADLFYHKGGADRFASDRRAILLDPTFANTVMRCYLADSATLVIQDAERLRGW